MRMWRINSDERRHYESSDISSFVVSYAGIRR